MKAVVFDQYGSVEGLRYTDIDKPQLKPQQLLVKVYATSVNPVDWKVRNGMFKLLTGYKFPRVVGSDIAGEVVEVGRRVRQFKPGDAIITFLSPILGGACAEYAAVFEESACHKPTNMSYEQAATVPVAALTALQGLRDQGRVQPGQKVLINGASGGVGTFAIQIAKALNAEVVAVCSARNFELMQELGADRVIDYTQQDFTQLADHYDVVFDVVAKQSYWSCATVLKPSGIYITTVPKPDDFLWGLLGSLFPGKKVKFILVQSRRRDLVYLKQLIEAGKLQPIIDRTYPLSELAEAHTYSEAGHTVGKVAITVQSA